jgi:N-acetylneuraminic acid mutarotase
MLRVMFHAIILLVCLCGDALGGAAATQPAAARYGSLPETTSSFGAVASEGWLYVYGGHVTPTHVYSTESASGRFHRLNLAEGKTWEELPGGPKLQGLNLAAHNHLIYRVGGMQSRNHPKDKPDNVSLTEAARFDPRSGKWEAIPPLPEARSSHDVAVVDGKLYAVGGWTMNGAKGNDWLQTMAVLDLSADKLVWQSIKQPFKRRALAAAAFEHKLYVLGGFTDDDDATLGVQIYDPKSNQWLAGPDLPGPPGNGFAPAACTLGNALYVSVADGTLYRLDHAAKTWARVATSTPRIVHRLAPAGSRILILGGAAKGDTLNLIEAVSIDPR